MNSHRQKPLTPWLLIILFLIISVTSIILGFLYYRSQKKQLLSDKQLELSAIADLKVRQIVQWRNERNSDALFLGENTPFVRQLLQYLKDQENNDLRTEIQNNFRSLTKNADYRNVLLIDTTGRISLAFPHRDSLMGNYMKKAFPEMRKLNSAILTDLHETERVDFSHIDLIIPFSDAVNGNILPAGFLALRIDPREALYPLIQTWPTPSRTAEALLVRHDGDEIVYLNEPRFDKVRGRILRKPAAEESLPSSMAVKGIEGTTRGIDYRGNEVVAAMKKIPGSSWYLVAKMDHGEVFSVIDKQMTMIIIIIILFVLTAGLLLGMIEWNENVRFYREKYEKELDQLALRKHYDYILKYANDIIFLTDQNSVIIEANDRAEEVYQRSREELIGMNLTKIISPGSAQKMAQVNKILDRKGHATFEILHARSDGSSIPMEISARKVDIEGASYYQSICRDITDRKLAEETLKQSEERFRKIFEESPLSIVMTGRDMGIIRANPAFCTMTGFSEEELKTIKLTDFIHPDYIAEDERYLHSLIAEEIPLYHSEKKYICKDGSIIWASTTLSIIRDNNGEVQFFVAMVEDITTKKLAESELENSFSLIKATLESTADGILVVDRKGKIIQYNQKFLDMWRIPPGIINTGRDEDLIRYVMDQLVYPEEFFNQVKKLYENDEISTSETITFKDGRVFERYSQPQKIAGESVGRVWSFRDITERKKAEAEIIAAKEKAEESDRLKTAFLHNVSHEIRTPMNAIIGFSALLNEPDITAEERDQFIDIIFQSGSQLLSIINDIVDIANIESGQVKLNIREINLNSSLQSLNEQFSYKQQAEGITINHEAGLPDDESVILTDSTKLIQVLSNLINNATKFTKEGRIDFGYKLRGENIEFFVKDTGIGIPAEHHEKIFDRFFQVDNVVSRKYGGTGLGLSICRAYVEILGGKIWLNSRPGEGTTFYFTIPHNSPSASSSKT